VLEYFTYATKNALKWGFWAEVEKKESELEILTAKNMEQIVVPLFL